QLEGDGAERAVWKSGRRYELPPVAQRDVHADRPRAAGPSPARVTELKGNGTSPRRPVVHHRGLERDPALRRDGNEAAEDEPGSSGGCVRPDDGAVFQREPP